MYITTKTPVGKSNPAGVFFFFREQIGHCKGILGTHGKDTLYTGCVQTDKTVLEHRQLGYLVQRTVGGTFPKMEGLFLQKAERAQAACPFWQGGHSPSVRVQGGYQRVDLLLVSDGAQEGAVGCGDGNLLCLVKGCFLGGASHQNCPQKGRQKKRRKNSFHLRSLLLVLEKLVSSIISCR